MADRLLDGRIYGFVRPDGLEDPGVAFRLRCGAEAVDLVICLDCDDLEVVVLDASGTVAHRGRSSFSGPPAGPDAVRTLAEAAFPADRVARN